METLPLILVFGILFAVMIIPQQRQRKQHRELMASLNEGDEVVLNSGIHGFIGEISSDVVWLEVSSGVELKVSKSSISGKIAEDSQDSVEVSETDDEDEDE